MVWSVIQNVRQGLKYRGGWRGLLEHMYTNGDYPFKFGTYMGCDAMGNRYYENRVDYPFGQHRWVEPAEIHNYDPTQLPPEWHAWMTSMNDATPDQEEEYIREKLSHTKHAEKSDVPWDHNIGYQEPYFNFNHMHDQSQIRSRGYGIGNPIVGLPPGAPDAYYTQPGSPYNEAFFRKRETQGYLDANRPYKNDLWKERLMTAEEKAAAKQEEEASWSQGQAGTGAKRLSPREEAIRARGGTLSR